MNTENLRWELLHDLILATCSPLYYIVMRAERPILLRFLNVLTSLNDFIIKRIVFLFLVKYIASGTLKRINLVSPHCDIGLHSFRAGGATVAANADVSERCLKKHGRWKSDFSKDGYILDSTEKRLSVSQVLGL